MTESIDAELKKTLIRKQGCFSKLNDQEINELATLFIETAYAAGDVIVKEGEPVDSVYLIISGTADVRHVFLQNNVSQFTSIATLGPEMPIGLNETGFYSISGVRTATVVALTDMLTLRMSVPRFHGFALANSRVNEIMRKNAEEI